MNQQNGKRVQLCRVEIFGSWERFPPESPSIDSPTESLEPTEIIVSSWGRTLEENDFGGTMDGWMDGPRKWLGWQARAGRTDSGWRVIHSLIGIVYAMHECCICFVYVYEWRIGFRPDQTGLMPYDKRNSVVNVNRRRWLHAVAGLFEITGINLHSNEWLDWLRT